jgi:protein-disulfide isomerase
VVETYGGRVNWVYRHFPLNIHNPGAQKQAEASECANELGGNEAFWKYADAIYARTKSNGNGFPINKLVPLAKEIGLDETEFQNCLKSGRYTERVQEDLAEGSRVGITGTPGNILLNNETGEVKFLKGAVPTNVLQENFSRMLEKKK